MKLSTYKRIDKQNFDSKYADLIDQLGLLFNTQMQAFYNAMNGNLSLTDNLFCVVKDIQVVVDSNGVPKNAAQIQIDKTNMRPLGCEVIKALNTTNSNTYPTGAPFLSYTPGTQLITINHITGLQPDQNYTLTVKIWGQ